MLWAEVGISVLIICYFSNEWTCTRKKNVEGLSCGFEVLYKNASKIKANFEFHKSSDDFYSISISCGKVTQLYEERGILCEQIKIAGDKLQIKSLSP